MCGVRNRRSTLFRVLARQELVFRVLARQELPGVEVQAWLRRSSGQAFSYSTAWQLYAIQTRGVRAFTHVEPNILLGVDETEPPRFRHARDSCCPHPTECLSSTVVHRRWRRPRLEVRAAESNTDNGVCLRRQRAASRLAPRGTR